MRSSLAVSFKREPKRVTLTLAPAIMDERLHWLDALRGSGVVLMLAFHLAFDLKTFLPPGAVDLKWISPLLWEIFPHIVGVIFLFSVGISSAVSQSAPPLGKAQYFSIYAWSSAKIAWAALLVTLGTAAFTPQFTIYFGVLHCIAVVKLLLFPFLWARRLALFLAPAFIAAGIGMRFVELDTQLLLWLGFPSRHGMGGDWYPIFPWLGVALLGVFCAKPLMEIFEAQNRGSAAAIYLYRLLRPLSWCGRHSLLIYLTHQPIFVGGIYLSRLLA